MSVPHTSRWCIICVFFFASPPQPPPTPSWWRSDTRQRLHRGDENDDDDDQEEDDGNETAQPQQPADIGQTTAASAECRHFGDGPASDAVGLRQEVIACLCTYAQLCVCVFILKSVFYAIQIN